MVNLIHKIDTFPNFKFLCVSILLFPLSVGLGTKLIVTDAVSFKRNDTELKLGQVKQEVRQGDRLVHELLEENRKLIEASQKAQRAAKRRKVTLPELEEIQSAAEDSQAVAEDLEENNEELRELVDEQPTSQPAIK